MNQFLKKTITIVFCIFSIITSLLFVFSEELNMENLLLPLVIITISGILIKFPFLYSVKIKNPYIVLLFISFLALFIRKLWILLVTVIPESDFYTYHTLAQNILMDKIPNPIFVSLFPHAFGFSKVLSFFYAVFGAEPNTAVYLNIVLNMGILLLIYYLGKNLINVNTGLVVASIYAFWPSQIFFNTFVLTEPLYTFGVLLILCSYFVIIKRVNKTIYLVLSFLVLGSAIGFLKLIRPAATIVLLSILFHYFFIAEKKICTNPISTGAGYRILKPDGKLRSPISLKRSDAIVVVNNTDKIRTSFFETGHKAILSAVLVLSCNIITGISIKGIEQKIGIDTARHTSGFYLLVGTNLEGKGKYNNNDAAILQALINEGIPADKIQRQLSELGMERILKTDIMSQIRHQIFKNKCMWRLDSDSISFTRGTLSTISHIDIKKHSMWLSDVADFYYSVFFLIALSSLFVLKKRIPAFYFVFYLYILGTVAAHMLAEVQSRYHYPVIPIFCILAATVLTRKPATGLKITDQ